MIAKPLGKTEPPDGLPRLAFVSEVPPLNLSAGPAQLYRLLVQYPPEGLLLCEDAGLARYPGFELSGVTRRRMIFNWTRLMRSRFGIWNGALTFFWDPLVLAGRLASALGAHGSQVVLSIAHGHVWRPAYLAARRLNLPYVLIVHDHWRYSMALPNWLDRSAHSRFATAYRGSSLRFVISPAMGRRYQAETGVEAQILSPLRLCNSEGHAEAPSSTHDPFVVAYAGGLDGEWARRAVADLAQAIKPLGARVLICQNVSHEALRGSGLRSDNVDIQPLLPALELHRYLRARADVLFLPMSFEAADRENVEICFPSKLTDYTVTALPVLVYAPPYSSIAEWVAQNPGAAATVDRRDINLLRETVRVLREDEALRARLGAAAAAAGGCSFDGQRFSGVSRTRCGDWFPSRTGVDRARGVLWPSL